MTKTPKLLSDEPRLALINIMRDIIQTIEYLEKPSDDPYRSEYAYKYGYLMNTIERILKYCTSHHLINFTPSGDDLNELLNKVDSILKQSDFKLFGRSED